jgi:hypothetical protein
VSRFGRKAESRAPAEAGSRFPAAAVKCGGRVDGALEGAMKRVLCAALAAAALCAAGCGDEKTTKYCSEICQIWVDCEAWTQDACMSECESAGDWDKDYLDCLKAQSCATLDACG